MHKEAKASEALHSPRPRVSRPPDPGHFGLPGSKTQCFNASFSVHSESAVTHSVVVVDDL